VIIFVYFNLHYILNFPTYLLFFMSFSDIFGFINPDDLPPSPINLK
jgi:hypothetical protein